MVNSRACCAHVGQGHGNGMMFHLIYMAERLGRPWSGIDISDMAYNLVREWLEAKVGFMGTALHDIEYRTVDNAAVTEPKPNPRLPAHLLYELHEGRCALCDNLVDFKNKDVDQIHPGSKGGTDEVDNLLMLCRECNLTKDAKSQSETQKATTAKLQPRSSTSNRWSEGRDAW